MPHWTQGDAVVNDIKLHYHRTGNGDKPPLVLAHGFTDNGLCWTPLAEALEAEYDIIMYDARGHGLSDAPEEDLYRKEHQAEDLAGLVRALGLHRPALMGHSMGAGTVATAAATYPDLASCIVLEDPGWRAGNSPLPPVEAQRAQVEKARRQTVEGKSKDRDYHIARSHKEFPSWPEAERGPWADAKMQLSPNVFHVRAEPDRDWRESVARIEVPTLLITGDPALGAIVTPEVAEEAARLWRRGEVAHIPSAGHSIRRENFTQYVEVVRRFLREYQN